MSNWRTSRHLPDPEPESDEGSAINMQYETIDAASEWLTAKEAAVYLKIRPRTVAEWAKNGRIPGHRLSGLKRCTWRFLRSELDAMLGVPSVRPESGNNESATV